MLGKVGQQEKKADDISAAHRKRVGKERQAFVSSLLRVSAQAPAKGQSELAVGPWNLNVFTNKLQVQ